MNAASISEHQSRPASDVPRDSASAATATGQGGFVDLVNLLLGSEDAVTPIEWLGQQPDSYVAAQNTNPPTRSPQEIADALIKTMTKGGRNFSSSSLSSNVFSDSAAKALERKPRNTNAQALLPEVVPLPAATPPVQPTDIASGQNSSGSNPSLQFPKRDGEQAGVNNSGPLAFALKLTPKQTGQPNSVATPDSSNDRRESNPESHASISTSATGAQGEMSALAVFSAGWGDQDALAEKARLAIQTASANSIHTAFSATGSTPRLVELETAVPTATATGGSVAAANAAEALRGAMPSVPPSPPQAAAAQDISVRVAQPNSRADAAVDVRVTERLGQVHVAVRTPDSGLQTSLRQDLDTLVNSLDRAGYHAEAISRHTESQSASSQMNGNGHPKGQNDSDSPSGRQFGRSTGGQQQHRQPERNPQHWIEAMEKAQ